MSPDAPATNDVSRAQEQLKLLEDLLAALKRGGADVPSTLTHAVKALRVSIDTGVDLGNSCTEASAALAEYTNKVNEACGDDAVCQAQEFHKYQSRNTDYTLNWNNQDSVVRTFVRTTLQRYLPQRICQNLDLCKPR